MARRRIVTRTPARREMVWIPWTLGDFVIAANVGTLLGVLNAAALALRPFTIVRTHLLLTWDSDQSAASEVPIGAVGMIVTSEQATTAGIASIPTPVTEADADFFVYQPLMSSFSFATAAGFESHSGGYWTVDSKAMRKVGINQDIACVVEESNNVGAFVGVQGRMLLKLH